MGLMNDFRYERIKEIEHILNDESMELDSREIQKLHEEILMLEELNRQSNRLMYLGY